LQLESRHAENASKAKKDKFWDFLEKEVHEAELEEQGIVLQMDGNLHAGDNFVNSMSICEGLITGQRKFKSKTERAVLGFFIVNQKLNPF
jgi:hypothetical protein